MNNEILKLFPYNFTPGQLAAVEDILHDLNQPFPMNRLLQADVGFGKTAVALYSAIHVAEHGYKTLIMVPTTILARQHFDVLAGLGWTDASLCVGGEKEDFSKSIIVGTTALLNRAIKNVALVIIDEQHKFGTKQRAQLQKYGTPHVLIMTATPIPRSVALTVFGDLDVTTITDSPIVRGPIITRWTLPGNIEAVYDIAEKQLANGRQMYVVFPRISGEEDTDNAVNGYGKIQERFSDYNVDLLTGRDAEQEKCGSLRRFKSGHTDILVSTVISEVGIDCPNATVTLIMGADRFGLSQLHQLRGRIARSTETAFCFLMASTANDTSIARLRTIEQTNDGFEIAEQDLRLRGPGELFSTKQHGLPDLKFASLIDDYELLLKARDLAKNLVDKLDSPEYNGLRKMLEIKYPNLTCIGVA